MKFKIMILTFCMFCCSLPIVAQQANDVTKHINSIKRNKHYLYAEATMKDSVEAYQSAKAILETIVSEWIHEQYPDENIELCIVKTKEHCQQLQTLRGYFFRAFVYVQKKDILPVNDPNEMTIFQINPIDSLLGDLPVVKVPVPQIITLDVEEQRMIDVYKFDEIRPYVKGLEKMDKIIKYGKYKTMPANGLCHLFIYNPQGEVVAVLRKEDAIIINLRTLQQDNITNYKNCGAIWLQLKPVQE